MRIKNREQRIRKIEAYIQMFLMIGAIFAFAYVLREAFIDNQVSNAGQSLGGREVFIKIYSALVKTFIGDKGFVSAEGASTCLQTTSGSICQEYASSNCNNICLPGKCLPTLRSQTQQCQMGTCQDSVEGTCQPMSPKEACESGNGIWYNDAFGNNAQCVKGCCTWGGGAYSAFVTQATCNRKQNISGTPSVFNKNIRDEITCLNLARNQEMSACVFSKDNGKSCKFTTRANCLSAKGNFTTFGGKQVLCTNPSLGVDCQKTTKTTCVNGKDEVYFLDSCGNAANIYNADKKDDADYWSFVVSKANSCNNGNTNLNSLSCGNCNYLLGSMCNAKENNAVRYGDNICHNLNCVDEEGRARKNGESWCLYDGKVGDGKDVVGSRQFKRVCKDGKVVTDPCADFRGEICQESKTKIEGVEFNMATCKINRWSECFAANSGNEGVDTAACADAEDCLIRSVNVDSGFSFDVCAPKYPEGFDIKSKNSGAKSYCSMGSQTCKVVYVKDYDGSWECKQNCNCESVAFTQQMNDLCVNLGDCGGKANIYGDLGSSGYSVRNAPRISLEQYKEFAKKQINQLAIQLANATGDDNQILAARARSTNNEGGMSDFSSGYQMTTAIVGAVGALAGLAGSVIASSATASTTAFSAMTGVAATNAGTAAGAAGTLGSMMGVLAAALLWLAVAAILFTIYTMVMGVGKMKTVTVSFSCYPWQPPIGGDKCKECMKDPLKPCSKYRCQSLGLECTYINEGTSQENCIAVKPKDANAPVITPLDSALPANYTYENVSYLGFKVKGTDSDGCIKSFSPLSFGINLSKEAQCKFDINRSIAYEDMQFYFNDNFYLLNHSMGTITVPSLESLGLPSYDPNSRANFNYYVRCQDVSGNKNEIDYVINFCIKPGDDISPPVIVAKSPPHNFVVWNSSGINTSIMINEPSDCRWDNNDTDYFSMSHNFSCANNISDQELLGWRCKDFLPLALEKNTSAFFIRCLDQPWKAGINDSQRNANVNSYLFNLTRSEKLIISSLSPINGTIWSGSEPVTVSLKATTNGGAYGGVAGCQYSVNGSQYIDFFNTYSTTHEQVFGGFTAGDKIINVKCKDLVGNDAYNVSAFNVSIDTLPATVTRVYNSNNNLVAVTNEPATCSFVKGEFVDYRCNFVNSTAMSGTDLLHSTALDNSAGYYIKCADRFGNQVNNSCNVVVKGGRI
jgi:hypothetical protein